MVIHGSSCWDKMWMDQLHIEIASWIVLNNSSLDRTNNEITTSVHDYIPDLPRRRGMNILRPTGEFSAFLCLVLKDKN